MTDHTPNLTPVALAPFLPLINGDALIGAIAVLDDAIEFEIATEEELQHRLDLKKYRIMLSRW